LDLERRRARERDLLRDCERFLDLECGRRSGEPDRFFAGHRSRERERLPALRFALSLERLLRDGLPPLRDRLFEGLRAMMQSLFRQAPPRDD